MRNVQARKLALQVGSTATGAAWIPGELGIPIAAAVSKGSPFSGRYALLTARVDARAL